MSSDSTPNHGNRPDCAELAPQLTACYQAGRCLNQIRHYLTCAMALYELGSDYLPRLNAALSELAEHAIAMFDTPEQGRELRETLIPNLRQSVSCWFESETTGDDVLDFSASLVCNLHEGRGWYQTLHEAYHEFVGGRIGNHIEVLTAEIHSKISADFRPVFDLGVLVDQGLRPESTLDAICYLGARAMQVGQQQAPACLVSDPQSILPQATIRDELASRLPSDSWWASLQAFLRRLFLFSRVNDLLRDQPTSRDKVTELLRDLDTRIGALSDYLVVRLKQLDRLVCLPQEHKVWLDGREFDIASPHAILVIEALASEVGKWVSSCELQSTNMELDGARIDRLCRKLPPALRNLIESKPGTGYRLTFPD